MKKQFFYKKILLLLPAIVLVVIFFAFQPNQKQNNPPLVTENNPVNTEIQLYYNFRAAYDDASKILIHLVWASTEKSPYTQYVLERSIDDKPYEQVAKQKNENLLDILTLRNIENYKNYNNIFYSSEDGGGFIFNELMDKNEFEKIHVKYRLKAQHTNGQIVYSNEIANYKIITQHSGSRAACPSVGSAPKGYTAVSGSATTQSCDCGTYTTTDYVEPCTASAPSGCSTDCKTACDCAYDPCCEHSCSQYSSCNCVKSKWTSCQSISTITIVTSVNTSCTAPTLSATPTNTCACTGAVNVTPTAGSCGNTSYTYKWSNGATSQDLSNVCPASYTVTVTDGCGKTAKVTSTVSNTSTALSLSITGTNTTCNQCNGAANLTVTGGTTAYSYKWSNSSTAQDLSGLCSGSYTVTVTDACSTTATKSVSIAASTVPTVTTTPTNTTCGQCNGAVSSSVSSGSSPYSYKWSNGSTSSSLSSICSGSYTVTVTDNAGCTATKSQTIAASTGPSLSTSVTGNTTCPACNGAVNLSVGSGTPTYTFKWSSGQTSEDINSICGGNYTVTVTDNAGCTATTTATVSGCILPVELEKFSAIKKDKIVILHWSTLSEINFDYFGVERSDNGSNFKEINEVKVGTASNQKKSYEYIDNNPLTGVSYYRLHLVDVNGNTSNNYSNVISVVMDSKELFNVNPTLTKGIIEISVFGDNENIEVTILDIAGKMVYKKKLDNIIGIYKFNEDVSGFSGGTYYVSFKSNYEVVVKKFIKY